MNFLIKVILSILIYCLLNFAPRTDEANVCQVLILEDHCRCIEGRFSYVEFPYDRFNAYTIKLCTKANITITCRHDNFLTATQTIRSRRGHLKESRRSNKSAKIYPNKSHKIRRPIYISSPQLLDDEVYYHIIDYSGNKIEVLKYGKFQRICVNTLNMSNNLIHSLDEDVFEEMNLLQVLDLSLNKIKTLPDNLLQPVITSLWHFYFQNNPLKKVQLNFIITYYMNAITLRNLKIKSRDLKSLQLVHYTELTIMDLSHNRIIIIDNPYFEMLEKLTTLDLSYNLVDTLSPDFVQDNTRLRSLNLSRNRLRSLESSLDIANLMIIDLSYNKLNMLNSFTFCRTPLLQKIILDGNPITTVDADAFYLVYGRQSDDNKLFISMKNTLLSDPSAFLTAISDVQFRTTDTRVTVDLQCNANLSCHCDLINKRSVNIVNKANTECINNKGLKIWLSELTWATCHKGMREYTKLKCKSNREKRRRDGPRFY
ncbi:hypothetical protein GJ496_006945 [Pomphorhynchus laevis]|nr:hypothetical protein GJ496_006945 [Pomphorhynchus laevis]